MEISLLKTLLENISSVLELSCQDNRFCEIVEKYYIKIEEVLKLIKPILESISDADVASDQSLQTEFAGLNQSVDELRRVLEDSHPLMSKVYFVLNVESLFTKVQTHGLDLLMLLQSCEGLPEALSSASLEHGVQKIKHMGFEKPSAIISDAIKDQVEGTEPSSGIRSKIADLLSLNSNQELLIELVALESLKESAEQLEKIRDVEYIEEMINLVTYMHDCFIEMKQSQSCNTVPIPPDFCCPLSLELMTDPVIVASGQTYEREYIHDWIDLGLTVCPKTMQSLVHTNLIPNYTVKALIASWCDSNNVTNVNLSSGNHQEEYTVEEHHVRSSSEDSMNGNGHEFNHEYEESVGPSSMSPPRKESSAGSEVDERSQELRNGSNEESIQQTAMGNISDAAGEVAAEPQPATPDRHSNQREYSPRFRNRLQNKIWRRPSERFGPRTVSSVTETQPGLSEVETQVEKLVEDLRSTSLDTVKNATSEIRLLAKNDKDIRNVIANFGAIPLLISLLHSPDENIQENSVTALLNLSINEVNKTIIGNTGSFEPFIHVLQTGSTEARENSAATLFSLSLTEENKIKIGRAGAIGPLVTLLGNGTPRGKKDATTALFNLSTFHENKARIVQEGAVKFLVELMEPAAGLFDKAVAVLSNLATIPEGRGVSVGMDVEGGENGSDLNAVLADENASVDPMDIGGSSEQNQKNGANFSQVFEIFGELWFKEEEEEMDKNDDVNVENGEDNGDEEYNREQAESEDHGFVVGDFVWGKIKSKLWWPGQIYDPSDASDNAAVLKQDAQLLVAYFGDRSFSWSSPKELKPFIDNFEEMSRQSDSKKFVNAVKKVLEEVGRGVEAELMCKCQSANVTKNVGVVNNGIKKGACAPKGNTTKVLVDRINPVELVSNLTRYAIMQPGTRVGELELTVLKSCLRAFYTKKDGFLLVEYHDPKCIEEGTKSGDADTGGPSEGPENGDDKLYQRRKQKSVAELMGEDGKKAKTTKDGGIKDKKKKSLVVSVTPESGGGGGVEEETMSPRQRKKSRYLSPPYLSPIGIGSGKLSLLGLGTGSFKEPKPEPEKAPEMAAKQLDDTLKKSSEKKAREKRRVREGSDPQVHKKKKKTDAAVSVGKVLDGLLRAAIDPSSFVQKDKNLATITELLSSFRSSIFKEGSSSQTGKKKDGEDTSELGFIKQKLEWMSEMVRTCEESEMNADVKARLEGGFQEVLGKVVKMRGK